MTYFTIEFQHLPFIRTMSRICNLLSPLFLLLQVTTASTKWRNNMMKRDCLQYGTRLDVLSVCGNAYFITLRAKLSDAVYCNRSCLCVCLCLFICGSVTTITQNCVHRSSPNWVCRQGRGSWGVAGVRTPPPPESM